MNNPQTRRIQWDNAEKSGFRMRLEQVPGRAGWCVMGIERLNNAAWAAGFAMATPEEDDFEVAVSEAPDMQWRPGQAVMVREEPVERLEWLKAFLGLLGRRVPVSPV